LDQTLFREAMSRWASGVTIIACRHEARVIATTVSAFFSLSLEPPLVLAALGPNATVLPFLQPHETFGISVLAQSQRRIASAFADSFPVIEHPFSGDVAPVISDALVRLHCAVRDRIRADEHDLVIANVIDAQFNEEGPLVRFRRRYHALSAR
jgi:flavin reductase (DIM6/NTAB) family NADH-FMN oxidoreductase RutF